MFTCPGVPMLLQGQEAFCNFLKFFPSQLPHQVGDCQPYCWPNGPALDWDRV